MTDKDLGRPLRGNHETERAFFEWWDRPDRPTVINRRIAFEAGYRAASVGQNAAVSTKGFDQAQEARRG